MKTVQKPDNASYFCMASYWRTVLEEYQVLCAEGRYPDDNTAITTLTGIATQLLLANPPKKLCSEKITLTIAKRAGYNEIISSVDFPLNLSSRKEYKIDNE
jgi:hypothetical protein